MTLPNAGTNIAGKVGNRRKSTPKYMINNYIYVNEDPLLEEIPGKKYYVHLISITRDLGSSRSVDRYTPAAQVYRGDYFDKSSWDTPMHAFDEALTKIQKDPVMQSKGYHTNFVLDGYIEKRFSSSDTGFMNTLLPLYQKVQRYLVAAFKRHNAALVMNTLGGYPVVGGQYDIKPFAA